MKPEYRIVVSTCDKYINALRPFAWLLNKYWDNPPDVVVLGFTPPNFKLPDNFSFYSVGKQEDYPIDRWSDQIIDGLNMLPDEVFIFMLEDMWITTHVNTRIVKMAYDYMEQFRYVARFDLTGDRWNAFDENGRRPSLYGKLGHVNLIWSDPNSQYHLSTMPALWRKEHLLSVLIRGETPWQVELHGTPRLSEQRNKMIVIGTDIWPLRNTLAFRGGETSKLLLDQIDPEDVKMMRALKIFHGLE